MREQGADPDTHDPAEAAGLLASLSDPDRLRLIRIGRSIGRTRGLNGEDLCQEAIARTLEGRRNWPKGISAIKFLAGAMQSIASERRPVGDAYGGDIDLDFKSPEPTPADAVESESERAYRTQVLLDLLAGDNEAQALLEGMLDGMNKAELCELLDGDQTKYDTVRRRIRRKLNKRLNLSEKNDEQAKSGTGSS